MHICSTLYREFKYMISQNCRFQKLQLIFNSVVDYWKSKCKIASFFKEFKIKFVAMQGFEEIVYFLKPIRKYEIKSVVMLTLISWKMY